MATTTNFGWETPDDTDLVKDGALAIRTLGSAIDTSLVDLKGGTTGQVLSKASNTDMDFTWVAQDDSNAIQNAIVDAKGDLIAASAADTPARLAVGNNGETLVADSSASTGLRWQSNLAAGKNKIINGDFGIWQRGTSFTPGLGVWTSDRFQMYTEGSGTTRNVSQQTFTLGTAPVSGYEGRYFFRYAQTVGPSANIGNNLIIHRIESVRTFAGQTVTFSFWAKAASTMTIDTAYAYQVFGTGGSPSANVLTNFATNITIGTSWARYSYTVTLPSISGKTIGTNNDDYLDIRLQLPLGSGATFTFDTWGWQLEAGNTATAFQTATGTLAGELGACQRYYWRFTGPNGYSTYGVGFYTGATTGYVDLVHPVTMRAASLSIDFANIAVQDMHSSLSIRAITSATLDQAGTAHSRMSFNIASGGTDGRGLNLLANNNANGYIGVSAEL